MCPIFNNVTAGAEIRHAPEFRQTRGREVPCPKTNLECSLDSETYPTRVISQAPIERPTREAAMLNGRRLGVGPGAFKVAEEGLGRGQSRMFLASRGWCAKVYFTHPNCREARRRPAHAPRRTWNVLWIQYNEIEGPIRRPLHPTERLAKVGFGPVGFLVATCRL